MARNSFKPGQPRPPGAGRKPGTPNKKTQELVAILEELKLDPVRALCDLLPRLEERDQKDVYQKLMEYIYPKRKAVELTGEGGGPIQTATPEQAALWLKMQNESKK